MKSYVTNASFILLLGLVLCSIISGQTYEYPDNLFGFYKIPEYEKTNGIRTIHYTEQRGDYVFKTKTETFDRTGKKIEEISQHAGIEEVHSGEMVRLGSKTVYIYDSVGRLYKAISFSPEGKRTGITINKYDGKNRLIEQVEYNSKEEKIRVWQYIRRSEKREIESINISYFGKKAVPFENNLFVFDDKGVCIKKIEYKKDDSIDTTHTFTYNEKGYISKYTKTYESFYGYTYEYKYDVKGNWIERKTTYFQSDKKGGIESRYHMSEYRIISYYDDEKIIFSQETQNIKSKN